MAPELIQQLGNDLFSALRERRTLVPFTNRFADITVEDAYGISLQFLNRRVAAGERVIGKKIGVTSKPVQDMLGVFQPDFGFLTDAMHCEDGATVSLKQTGLIQPKAEGEIAFMLKADLKGPGITREQVMAATEWVAPCFEIVDSRIDDWKIKIQDTVADNASCGVFVVVDSRIDDWKIKIQDTVADNASCGVFVVGQQHTNPYAIDLAAASMQMWKNNAPSGAGLGSAVQGHPAEAVAWLANTLGAFGIPFKAGELILSGSLAPLVTAVSGDHFTMQIEGLGGCSIQFSE